MRKKEIMYAKKYKLTGTNFRWSLIIGLALCCGTTPVFSQEKKRAEKEPMAEKKGWKTLSGEVTDAATGKPLPGVRITYKNASAAISDSTGKFMLEVPDYSVSISIAGDGFQSKIVALRGRQTIRTALYEGAFQSYFDEVTINDRIYNRANLAGASGSVVSNGTPGVIGETPDNYLQGKLAGLQVIRRSGTPGIGANLLLRGFSSLYATNQPLFVIDGVVFDVQSYGTSLMPNHFNNPLNFIDVKDIDNITVLKEGASQYGTRGANGVILITTARARQEATRIDVSVFGGTSFAPENLPVMSKGDYRTYLSEMLQSKGLNADEISALPYMNNDPATNTEFYRYQGNQDWQRQVLSANTSQNAYMKVTGGDNIAKYALSLGYMKSQGVFTNTGLTRYNVRFNADFNLSQRLTANTNISFTFNEQKLKDLGTSTTTNPLYSALVKAPFLTINDVNNSGVFSPTLAAADVFATSNPVALTRNMMADNKNYRFLGAINFGYKLSDHISLASTLAVTMDKVRETFFVPGLGVVPDTLETAVAVNRSGAQVVRMFSVYNDSRIAYQKVFNNVHDFSARLGVRYNTIDSEQDYIYGFNSATDKLTGVGYGANALRRVGGSLGNSSWMNTYFTTDYNFRGKYLASFSLAVDGSSRFGREAAGGAVVRLGNRNYPLMPSLDLAWVASSENFMEAATWIDLLKIRASAGITGNNDIGNFTARRYYVSQNLLGVQGLVRGNAGNEALQWETNTRLNAGIDLSVWNERLSLSFDAYHRKTDDMIVYEPAPAATGMEYNITNSGAMKTTGWEAVVQGRILNGKKLKWDLGFNISAYKSEVTTLPMDAIVTDYAGGSYITRVGGAPNAFYGYRADGVFASGTAATALSFRNEAGELTPFKGGDIRFNDTNGDNIIDAADREVIGNPNPDFFGAINTGLVYGNWNLEALVTFSQGNDAYNYTRRQLESMDGYANQTKAVMNRWRNDGDQTNMPRAAWGDPSGNARFSSRWIEDASYIRLRTLSVSYNIPIRPGALKYTVVYLSGNNLLTATKYKGFDPEFGAASGLFGMGVDAMMEPQFRSVQAGIKLGL